MLPHGHFVTALASIGCRSWVPACESVGLGIGGARQHSLYSFKGAGMDVVNRPRVPDTYRSWEFWM